MAHKKFPPAFLRCLCFADLTGEHSEAPIGQRKGQTAATGNGASAFSLSVGTLSVTGTTASSPRGEPAGRRHLTATNGQTPAEEAPPKPNSNEASAQPVGSADGDPLMAASGIGAGAGTSTAAAPALPPPREPVAAAVLGGVSSTSAFTEVFHPWRHPRRPKVRTSRVSPADGTADELSTSNVCATAIAATGGGDLSPSASTASLPHSVDGRGLDGRDGEEDYWADEEGDVVPSGQRSTANDAGGAGGLKRGTAAESGVGEDDDDDDVLRQHPGMVTIPSFHKSASTSSRVGSAGGVGAYAKPELCGAPGAGPSGDGLHEPRAAFVRRGASRSSAELPPAGAAAPPPPPPCSSPAHARRSSFSGDSSTSLVGPGTVLPLGGILLGSSAQQSSLRVSQSLRATPPAGSAPPSPAQEPQLLQPSGPLRPAPLGPAAGPPPTLLPSGSLRLAPLAPTRGLLTPSPSLRPPPPLLPACSSLPRDGGNAFPDSPPPLLRASVGTTQAVNTSHAEIVPDATDVTDAAGAAALAGAQEHHHEHMLRLPPPHPLLGPGPGPGLGFGLTRAGPGGCSFGRTGPGVGVGPGAGLVQRSGVLAPIAFPTNMPGEAFDSAPGVSPTLNRLGSLQAAYRQLLQQDTMSARCGQEAADALQPQADRLQQQAQPQTGSAALAPAPQPALSPSQHPPVGSSASTMAAAAAAAAAEAASKHSLPPRPPAVVVSSSSSSAAAAAATAPGESAAAGQGALATATATAAAVAAVRRRSASRRWSEGGEGEAATSRAHSRRRIERVEYDGCGGSSGANSTAGGDDENDDDDDDSVVGDLPPPPSLRATPSVLIRALSLEPMCRTGSVLDPSRPSPGALSDVYDSVAAAAMLRMLRGGDGGGRDVAATTGGNCQVDKWLRDLPAATPPSRVSRRAFEPEPIEAVPEPEMSTGSLEEAVARGGTPSWKSGGGGGAVVAAAVATAAAARGHGVAAATAAEAGLGCGGPQGGVRKGAAKPSDADSFRCLMRELD